MEPLAAVGGVPFTAGTHEYDNRGKTLAPDGNASWAGLVLFGHGDLDFWTNDVGIPHWSSDACCGKCFANKSTLNFKHFAHTATWRQTTMDQGQFKARFSKPGAHVVMDHMIQYGLEFWALDTLHVIDYNGVASHACANALVSIIRGRELGPCNQTETIARPVPQVP